LCIFHKDLEVLRITAAIPLLDTFVIYAYDVHMNIWKKMQLENDRSPVGRQRRAGKEFTSSLLWTLGALVVLVMFAVSYFSGFVALNPSTVILFIIVAAFFVISVPDLIKKYRERKKE